MNDIFSQPFAKLVDHITKDDPRLNTIFGQVKGKLVKYAGWRNKNYEDLQLVEIASIDKKSKEKLNENLVKFINSLKKSNREGDFSYGYKSSIFSIIKRLTGRIIVEANSEYSAETNNESSNLIHIPPWMDSILDYIPRRRGNKSYPLGDPRRRQLPLSEDSQKLLLTLDHLSRKHAINSFESLFVTHKKEFIQETNDKFYGKDRRSFINGYQSLGKRFGFIPTKKAPGHLSLEFWSPTAKKQWETFKSLALQGVPANSFLSQQEQLYKVKLNRLKKKSIQNYLYSLEIGLSHCVLPAGDWSFKDLLDTKKITIELPDGRPHPHSYNEIVDGFRKREQERESSVKRKGFDSAVFGHFRSALIAVANYNGLAYQVQKFRDAYKTTFDKELRELKKSKKDKLYTITEIDGQLDALEERFNEIIIVNKTFDPKSGMEPKEFDEAMRFCQFYAMFLVMRFVGLRQINVRNLRVMKNPENRERPGGNIGFRESNGNLVLHFEKHEMKNNKILHFEFNPESMDETHGPLIRGLRLYDQYVYKHVLSNKDDSLDDHYFVQKSEEADKYTRLVDHEGNFGSMFTSMVQDYLVFESLNAKNYLAFNPHFLRRVCINWLVNDLRMPLEGASYYVADTIETLIKEYLDKDRIHDASHFVEAINRKLKDDKKVKKDAELAQKYLELLNQEKALRKEQQKKYEEEMAKLNQSHEREIQFMSMQLTTNEQQINTLQQQVISLLAQNANLVEQNSFYMQLLNKNPNGSGVINM